MQYGVIGGGQDQHDSRAEMKLLASSTARRTEIIKYASTCCIGLTALWSSVRFSSFLRLTATYCHNNRSNRTCERLKHIAVCPEHHTFPLWRSNTDIFGPSSRPEPWIRTSYLTRLAASAMRTRQLHVDRQYEKSLNEWKRSVGGNGWYQHSTCQVRAA